MCNFAFLIMNFFLGDNEYINIYNNLYNNIIILCNSYLKIILIILLSHLYINFLLQNYLRMNFLPFLHFLPLQINVLSLLTT